jgi:hypothetical protein
MILKHAIFAILLLSFTNHSDCNELGFIKDLNGGACFAYLVEDINTNKRYVFKQTRKKDLSLYRDAFMEYVWSKVAQLVGIATNNVEFINQNFISPEKAHENTLGTLHDYIETPESSQAKKDITPSLAGPWNHLTFTSSIQHTDLAKIAALDLISGNADRHEGNMLYDCKKDQYIAIDFGYSSRSMHIHEASTFFKKMAELPAHSTKLSKSEQESLLIFINTLKELCKLIHKKHINYIFIEAMKKSIAYGAPQDVVCILYELFSLQLTVAKKESLKIIRCAEIILSKSK